MDQKDTFFLPAIARINSQYQRQQLRRAFRSAENTAADAADPKLKAACQEMESLFVNQLFKELRATVRKSGFISGGRAEEIFTSMLDTEMSRKISASHGIGLSEILFEQLSRQSGRGQKEDPESGND